jgi:hypothetical protein
VLNFGKLRAVALNYYPDYYPIRNELNQVAASRLEITRLVRTGRVVQALAAGETARRSLSGDITVQRVNAGWAEMHLDCTAPTIPGLGYLPDQERIRRQTIREQSFAVHGEEEHGR